jgi:hypothetical protein
MCDCRLRPIWVKIVAMSHSQNQQPNRRQIIEKMEQPSRDLKNSVRNEDLMIASTEYTHRYPNHVSLALSIPHIGFAPKENPAELIG